MQYNWKKGRRYGIFVENIWCSLAKCTVQCWTRDGDCFQKVYGTAGEQCWGDTLVIGLGTHTRKIDLRWHVAVSERATLERCALKRITRTRGVFFFLIFFGMRNMVKENAILYCTKLRLPVLAVLKCAIFSVILGMASEQVQIVTKPRKEPRSASRSRRSHRRSRSENASSVAPVVITTITRYCPCLTELGLIVDVGRPVS